MTAKDFLETVTLYRSEKDRDNVKRFYKGHDKATKPFGVRFGILFSNAKAFKELPLKEILKLLKSPYYEMRLGAVSILDFKARDKKLPDSSRKELFDFYVANHDHIDNWDLVDRAAPHVVGEYLVNREHDILFKLARANDPWRRRTAIVSTHAFIRRGDVEDTFALADILVHDKDEFVNKAVGSWIREAGKKAPKKLLQFLDTHAAHMPAVTLRYATEKLDARSKKHYQSLRQSG